MTIFFLFNERRSDTLKTLQSLREQEGLDKIVVLQPSALDAEQKIDDQQDGLVVVEEVADTFFTGKVIDRINAYGADYNFIYTKTTPLLMGYRAVSRMVSVCSDGMEMVYADHYQIRDGQTVAHPLIDCQLGGVRNDFDFGSVQLYAGPMVSTDYKYAALYYNQLCDKDEICSRVKIHLPEYIYTEQESDLRQSGAKQFDYVNPAMREVQVEMEQAFTRHLSIIDCLLTPDMIRDANLGPRSEATASVIIPVRNRERTIGDAIRSALSQVTDFPFNVIVVDNHSTDGTTAAIEEIRNEELGISDSQSRVVHLIPERDDLGIGGCWDLAVRSEHCGRFAVQLDSDDLYSGTDTLQRIVDKFYETKAAMVIGSYSLVDFNLNPLPPGLIDHREWTDHNGMNNALRINGLGAPRAFYVPVLRKIGFPNTSYGEDYAVGLAISRQYKIGRIYDSLYLCRRWEGNSDAALPLDKINRNNTYKDWLRTIEIQKREDIIRQFVDRRDLDRAIERQLAAWPELKQRFEELDTKVLTRQLETDSDMKIAVQYNPARIRSTGAKVDKASIANRSCFLCQDNQPKEQMHFNHYGKYQFCINPYPILHRHFTIPLMAHKPQVLGDRLYDLFDLILFVSNHVFFYNGAQCGASAPDHFHFQMGAMDELPLQRDYDTLVKDAQEIDDDIKLIRTFAYPLFACGKIDSVKKVINALPTVDGEPEPRFNLIAWHKENTVTRTDDFVFLIIPRKKLRPDCYFAEGDNNFCISPGSVDMSGLIITPREEDFRRLDGQKALSILREVTLSEEEINKVVNKLKENG